MAKKKGFKGVVQKIWEDPFNGLNPFNPKTNSLGDIYDNTLGPQNLRSQALEAGGYNKAAKMSSLPSWDALGKPGEAFADFVDTQNGILPPDWRQYAQPVESALLNFVPGVGPLLSAGFNTAYQGGVEQRDNKGFDWGELGKNAAINFGTAAATMGAGKLLQNASTANAAKTFNPGPSGFADAARVAGGADSLGTSALNPFSQLGTSAAATPGFAASAIPSTTSSLSNAGISSALNGFNNPASSSSLVPQAQAAQSSGLGDTVYKNVVQHSPDLVNKALTDTLAPPASTPIAGGALDSFGTSDSGGSGGYQFGDILNAFGGNEINNPNANGVRIDSSALDQIGQRLSANNYLQQSQARDQALPAGQYTPNENTPYANRLSEINKGTDQSFSDLLGEVGNYNKYYGLIDSNPGITPDQLDTYLNDPTSGLIGDFNVSPEQQDYFKGLRPLNPLNSSLLH